MSLPGEEFERLCDAINDAFSVNDLEQLLRFKLNGVKAEVEKGDKRAAIFNLLSRLERTGWLLSFLIAASAERSQKADLLNLFMELTRKYTTEKSEPEPTPRDAPLAPDKSSENEPEHIATAVRGPVRPRQEESDRTTGTATDGNHLPEVLKKLYDNWKYSCHPDFYLATFCGNYPESVVSEITPRSKLLSEPGFDLQSVYYLWADPRTGGKIFVQLLRAGKLRHLVRFHNGGNAQHTSNIAFRPTGRTALRSRGKPFNRLVFRVRIPELGNGTEAEDTTRGENDAEAVVLGVRLVDRYRTHWIHAENRQYSWKQVRCPGAEKWQEIRIDLPRSEWLLFESDGNPIYNDRKPHFSEIMAVVIEFAKSTGGEFPVAAPGSGVVEIADFTIDGRDRDDPIEEPMPNPQNPALAPLFRENYTPADLRAVRDVLERHGTFAIPRLRSGLFSAAPTTDYSKGTNYHAVWIRDNVHIAYAHLAHGRPEVATATARALGQFLRTQAPRFDQLIANPALKDDVSYRPHVRFDGDTLAELPQEWSHAQNDALGYFLWLYASVALKGALPADEWDVDTLVRLLRYFRAIEYWADEDSGHWEEIRKVSASSIGTVVAGLRKLRELVRQAGVPPAASPTPALTGWNRLRGEIPEADLDALIRRGEEALSGILPAECNQPDLKKRRLYDAALLFLIYPLDMLDEATADQIVDQVETHLRGPIGIKRYLGDSFYCENYESLMRTRNDDPTRDFSNDIAGRDVLLRAGGEAQWCLFDPILSVIYGRRYQRARRPDDLRKQTHYLNRALAQITREDLPRCDAFRCAELYYTDSGKVQTSKSVPLLWTQANLWTALEAMRVSLVSPGL